MPRQYELRLITQGTACQILGISSATLFRYLNKLSKGGVAGLRHGNTGKKPYNRMEESQRRQITHLVCTKYRYFQPALVCKYLFRDEGISVSEEFIRKIIKSNEGARAGKGLEEPHPLRRRRNRFGELIQIDGSPHRWFSEDKGPCSLLTFVDDASGKITAAGFFLQKQRKDIFA